MHPIAILECRFAENIFAIRSDAPLTIFAWSEKLSNEYKESEYVLSKSEQKILDKILIEYKVKVKIKL